jgi:hypothetical protein
MATTAATTQPTSGYGTATSTGYPALPSTLATDGNTYRPGSTAGAYGVQNAAYSQPSTTSPPSTNPPSTTPPASYGGTPTYGNTYTR